MGFFNKTVNVKKHSTEKLITIYKKLSYGQKHFLEVENELRERDAFVGFYRDDEGIKKTKEASFFEHGENSIFYWYDEDFAKHYKTDLLYYKTYNCEGSFSKKREEEPNTYIIETLPAFIAAYTVCLTRNKSITQNDFEEYHNGIRKGLELFDLNRNEARDKVIGKSDFCIVNTDIKGLIDIPEGEEINDGKGSVLSQLLIKTTCDKYQIEFDDSSSEIKLSINLLDQHILSAYRTIDSLFNPKHQSISALYT